MAKKKEEIIEEAVKDEIIEEPEVIEDDTVTIRLPRERDNAEDMVVWVNDRRFLIKRGVSVDVPRCVAEVLEHQEEMMEQRYEYESAHQR